MASPTFKLLRVVLPLIVGGLAGVGLVRHVVRPAAAPVAAAAPAALPAFTAQTIEGTTVASSALTGRVVVLNFWATWCPHCRRELPELAQFAVAHQGDCLSVLALSNESVPTLTAFAEHRGLPFQVGSVPSAVEDAFGVDALPTTLILDAHGAVRSRIEGATTRAELDRVVQPLLGTNRC